MSEEELKNGQNEESLNKDNTDENQPSLRMRHRIPRGEKIVPKRENSYHYEERRNYGRDNQYERRPYYSRPSNNYERQDYHRRTYNNDVRRTNYRDDDELQFTNNPRTYQDAGISRENVIRSRNQYTGPKYQEDRYHQPRQQTRNYNNYDNNVNQSRFNNYRERESRVAYARNNYAGERPYHPQNTPASFKRQVPRQPKEIQIPSVVMRYKDMTADPTQPIRLNRYLSNAGVCSRRDADTFIKVGMVKVNDEVVTELGTKVMRSDVIKFKNRVVQLEDKIYVLLNKPKDYVTTSDDPQNRKTVLDLVRGACSERIYPVGRLDRNTTGVLLMTNDGELASRLTHPKYLKKKIYHVFLNKEVTEEDMESIRNGITLEDGEIKADAIEYAKEDEKNQVGIEIHSGKNRIVRRIFESLGYHVTKLDRVYFAGLTKKNLRRGQWRYLTEEEVSMLKMGAFE